MKDKRWDKLVIDVSIMKEERKKEEVGEKGKINKYLISEEIIQAKTRFFRPEHFNNLLLNYLIFLFLFLVLLLFFLVLYIHLFCAVSLRYVGVCLCV